MKGMRVLGLDVGGRWIGVAVSDPEGKVVQPLRMLDRREVERDPANLRRLCEAMGVGEIVIGLPLRTDGKPSERAEEVRRFGEWLEGALGIPVRFFDERLTTKAAEAILRAEGRKVERERKEAVSASLILEGYLKLRRARESD